MANDSAKTVVADGGTIYFAPAGTTMPTDEAASLDAAFIDTGFVSEDGVQLTFGQEKVGLKGWQSRGFDIRRLVESQNAGIGFSVLEWKFDTVEFALGATMSEPTTGHFKLAPRDPSDGPDQRAFVLEFADGDDRNYRLCAPVVEVDGDVSTELVRNAFAAFPLTVAALFSGNGDPWYWLTDDEAWDPSAS